MGTVNNYRREYTKSLGCVLVVLMILIALQWCLITRLSQTRPDNRDLLIMQLQSQLELARFDLREATELAGARDELWWSTYSLEESMRRANKAADGAELR